MPIICVGPSGYFILGNAFEKVVLHTNLYWLILIGLIVRSWNLSFYGTSEHPFGEASPQDKKWVGRPPDGSKRSHLNHNN